MSYELAQSVLTSAIEAVAIIGFTSIVAKEALRHIRKAPTAPALAVEPAPVVEVAEVEEAPVNTPDTQAIEPEVEPIAEAVTEVSLADIDVDALTLRQTREVVKAINKTLDTETRIRQKVNGKDVPYRLLQAQIKRYLEQRPEAAQAIAEVLKAA